MPTTTTKTKKTTKKGSGLTKKVGPVPLYFYLIGVGIVVLYLYYRHRQSQSGGSTAGSQNQAVIPSGVVVPSSTSTGNNNQGSNDASTTYPTDYATQTDLTSAISSINDNTQAAIAGITFPTPNINITVPNTGNGSPSKATVATKTAAKNAQPFGGVLRTKATKAGGTITYYRSGRIVERQPGKSAFVVHK